MPPPLQTTLFANPATWWSSWWMALATRQLQTKLNSRLRVTIQWHIRSLEFPIMEMPSPHTEAKWKGTEWPDRPLKSNNKELSWYYTTTAWLEVLSSWFHYTLTFLNSTPLEWNCTCSDSNSNSLKFQLQFHAKEQIYRFSLFGPQFPFECQFYFVGLLLVVREDKLFDVHVLVFEL